MSLTSLELTPPPHSVALTLPSWAVQSHPFSCTSVSSLCEDAGSVVYVGISNNLIHQFMDVVCVPFGVERCCYLGYESGFSGENQQAVERHV